MSYSARVIEVLIASPSDVSDERRIAREAIHEWNSINAKDRKTILVPLTWENDSTPESGERPQESLNRQLLKDADLLIAVFWTRIGSPTGKSPSGTVEEIEEHVRAGKPAMLYFSSNRVNPDEFDQAQYDALKEFKSWAKEKNLYQDYATPEEFGKIVGAHLARKVIDKFRSDRAHDQAAVGLRARSFPLSGDAVELLSSAASDMHGQILVASGSGGTIVQANGKQFTRGQSARSDARWRSALAELVRDGLVEDGTGNREVYQVTERGFDPANQKLETAPTVHIPDLSKEARALLAGAAKTSTAAVLVHRDMCGAAIQTTEQVFNDPKDPRSRAKWEHAIRELVAAGVVEDSDGSGEHYDLTHQGFQIADAIESEEQSVAVSKEARELLAEAVASSDKRIALLPSAAGLIIMANSKQFAAPPDERSVARWKSAADELTRAGLVEDRHGNGKFFNVTDAGYCLLESTPVRDDLASSSSSHFQILKMFSEHESLTQHALAELCSVQPQKAQYYIDSLRSEGHIDYYRPAANGKPIRYALTPQGRRELVGRGLL